MDTVFTEIQKLQPSALIELYTLDLTKFSRGVRRFHAGTNELLGNVVWQGQIYERFPIEITGFERSGTGSLPRPVAKMSNAFGEMAAYARECNYFLGRKVTRKRTFARFLDSDNFPGGNPTADPMQMLPDEVWFVDRKSNETPSFIEFELASALDLVGTAIPRRQMIQNCCSWVYRSANCTYAGGPVAMDNGEATGNPALDKCGKRLSDCKLRFGSGILPYGGFPGCGLVR
jgi:lambda family phage minor tail protein L